MKPQKLLYFVMPMLLGASMLLGSQPKEHGRPPTPGINFTDDNIFRGRELTDAESTTVRRAIDSIRKCTSIRFANADNNSRTVPCTTIARQLEAQLNSGRIEVETLDTMGYGVTSGDALPSTQGDELNLDSALIHKAGADSTNLVYLQEVLVHEWTHKTQTTQNEDEAEVEAHAAELAYKDTIRMDTTDSEYRFAKAQHDAYAARHNGQNKRPNRRQKCFDHHAFFQFGAEFTGSDLFTSYRYGDTSWYEYDLGSTRASDMMVFEDYFTLQPGHSLVLLAGGVPWLGVGRLLRLDIYEGEVVSELGVQDFPGAFFYAITASHTQSGLYYVLDSFNTQILAMTDTDEDLLPDAIVGVYANLADCPMLAGMHSLDAATHPTLGSGVILSSDDAHLGHHQHPYEGLLFLPDANGDNLADECMFVPKYEFLVFTPHIQEPLPWEGDQLVSLFAPWNHVIDVWATDSLGLVFLEHLGTTQMLSGVDEQCGLLRPLIEGEFVLPYDTETGARPKLATEVISPIPKELTIQFMLDDGMLHLRWKEVPGADHYNVYESEDPELFPPTPSHTADTNEFAIPLPPDEKLFYRVTAER